MAGILFSKGRLKVLMTGPGGQRMHCNKVLPATSCDEYGNIGMLLAAQRLAMEVTQPARGSDFTKGCVRILISVRLCQNISQVSRLMRRACRARKAFVCTGCHG